jgi:DNA repair protein RadC
MLPDNEIELLAKILCDGNPTKSGRLQAAKLIEGYISISNLVRSIGDVGIDLTNKEKERLSIFREAVRAAIPENKNFEMTNQYDVMTYLKRYANMKEESLIVFGLGNHNNLMCEFVIASGWEGGINVHPRQVFARLVRESVGRFILAHNHPSGNVKPSVEDLEFTRQIRNGAQMLDITLLDHIIVGDGFRSMRANGDIDF